MIFKFRSKSLNICIVGVSITTCEKLYEYYIAYT